MGTHTRNRVTNALQCYLRQHGQPSSRISIPLAIHNDDEDNLKNTSTGPSRWCHPSSKGSILVTPTTAYVAQPGTVPPIPSFLLHITNIMFGTSDRYEQVLHIGPMDESVYKLSNALILHQIASSSSSVVRRLPSARKFPTRRRRQRNSTNTIHHSSTSKTFASPTLTNEGDQKSENEAKFYARIEQQLQTVTPIPRSKGDRIIIIVVTCDKQSGNLINGMIKNIV
jgi:hypothetical protein